MNDKIFQDFKTPQIDPNQSFIQELAAVAKDNKPLVPLKPKKTFAWKPVLVGLGTATTALALGLTFINPSQPLNSSPQDSSSAQGFQSDSGSSSRYPSSAPNAEPGKPNGLAEQAVCTLTLAEVDDFVLCVLRKLDG